MRLGSVLVVATSLVLSAEAAARERIEVVGSSTAVRFIQPAAEQFGLESDNLPPSLEATGTGVGFDLFCAGVGEDHPDIIAAMRPMTDAERTQCTDHGVAEITEIEIGRDAMVLIRDRDASSINLTKAQLFAGIAGQIVEDGDLAKNSAELWSEVDESLPDAEILVMTPEPNTTAAAAFQDLTFDEGCQMYQGLGGIGEDERNRLCRSFRTDGRVVNAPKRFDKVLDWLERNKTGYAAVDYTTYKEADDQAALNPLDGVEPSDESIGNKQYPLVSGIYVYVKEQHAKLTPGLQPFLYELTSERSLAPDGYLADQGLVPLDDIGRNKARDQALQFGL